MQNSRKAMILVDLALVLRGIGETKGMGDTTEDNAPVVLPEKIQEAERWRQAGKRLRALAPQVYEQVFAMLVASLPGDSDDYEDSMHESYFIT